MINLQRPLHIYYTVVLFLQVSNRCVVTLLQNFWVTTMKAITYLKVLNTKAIVVVEGRTLRLFIVSSTHCESRLTA